MGKRKIAFGVKGSHEETLQKLQSALKTSGYKVKMKSSGRMVFTKGAFKGLEPLEKTHKLHVSISPSKFGVSISMLIETGVGEPVWDLDVIENHIRNVMDSVFQVHNPLIRGKVSDDGREVVLFEENKEVSLGPFENRFGEHRRGMNILMLIISSVFGFILAAYILDLIYDISETAHFNEAPVFIAFLLFFVLLGPITVLYSRNTKKLPNRILPTFEGVYLYYLTNPTTFVPWSSVLSIERPPGFNTQGLFWRTEDGKKVFAAMQNPGAEYTIDLHNVMKKGFGKIYETPAYKAFNLVPPKTEVHVSKRPLSAEEMDYRKLVSRFLSSGPPIPVYISHEDHVRLAREFLNKTELTREELRDAALNATSQKLWVLGAELYQRLVRDYPDEEEFNNDLAGCLMESDRIKEAFEVIDLYLDKHPNSSRCNVMKALLAMKIQRIDEALHHVGRAVELDSNNIPALNLWFEIVETESGTAQAISELDYLTIQHAGAWGPHLTLGYKVLFSGNMEDALKHMKKAYEIEVNDSTVHGLTDAYFKKQDIDAMISVMESYQKEKKLPPVMILNLANGYFKRGQKLKAFNMLDTIDYSMGIDWVEAADDLRRTIQKEM